MLAPKSAASEDIAGGAPGEYGTRLGKECWTTSPSGIPALWHLFPALPKSPITATRKTNLRGTKEAIIEAITEANKTTET